MQITEPFMKAMGSGADPNDDVCMSGFNLWQDHFPKPMTYSQSIAFAEVACKDATLIEPTLGRLFLLWAKRLKTRPEAFIQGGDAVFLDEFEVSVDDVRAYHNSLDAAIADFSGKGSKVKLRELADVHKVIRKNGTMTLYKIKPAHMKKCDEVMVFDPFTGTSTFFTDAALAEDMFRLVCTKINEPTLKRGAIKQRLHDPVEDLYVWQDVTPEYLKNKETINVNLLS